MIRTTIQDNNIKLIHNKTIKIIIYKNFIYYNDIGYLLLYKKINKNNKKSSKSKKNIKITIYKYIYHRKFWHLLV